MVKILEILDLNTLSCQPTRLEEFTPEHAKMKCTIHSLDEHDGEEVDDVYSISGDIAVLAGEKGRIWVKPPIIGQDVVMMIDEREPPYFPTGKDITITVKHK